MTVAELLERISSEELAEWFAYFDLVAEQQPRGNKPATVPMDPVAFRAALHRVVPKGKRIKP